MCTCITNNEKLNDGMMLEFRWCYFALGDDSRSIEATGNRANLHCKAFSDITS
jgi:hypothetical protein